MTPEASPYLSGSTRLYTYTCIVYIYIYICICLYSIYILYRYRYKSLISGQIRRRSSAYIISPPIYSYISRYLIPRITFLFKELNRQD